MHTVILSLWLLVIMTATLPAYAETMPLEQRLERLSGRVSALEQRLDALEGSAPGVAVATPASTGRRDVTGRHSNWARLSIGDGYGEVRELLGEPQDIKKGSVEYWYYSDDALQGVHVKFLFGKVNGWSAPAE